MFLLCVCVCVFFILFSVGSSNVKLFLRIYGGMGGPF